MRYIQMTVFELAKSSGIPLQMITALVCNGVSSPHSKRAYERAIQDFLHWSLSAGATEFSKAGVQEYRSFLEEHGLAASTISLRMCAIRKLAEELADNGVLAPEKAAAIRKVKGAKRHGVRLGNWLSGEQAEQLIMRPDLIRLKGIRDRALLSVLLGTGLRRSEAVALEFEDIQQRDGRWVIADLVGKHGRVRTVPVPGWAKAAVDAWAEIAGLESGRVFRPVNKAGRIVGTSMTAQGIYIIVTAYGKQCGFGAAPHDMRRSFAKLARKGHAALEQIQLSLGHASVVTTELYLGTRQDLNDAPCDHLGLRFEQDENGESKRTGVGSLY